MCQNTPGILGFLNSGAKITCLWNGDFLRQHVILCLLKFLSYLFHQERWGNGSPLQCSCLVNPLDSGAWQATVRGVTKSRTRLSDYHSLFHCVCWCTGPSCEGLWADLEFSVVCFCDCRVVLDPECSENSGGTGSFFPGSSVPLLWLIMESRG